MAADATCSRHRSVIDIATDDVSVWVDCAVELVPGEGYTVMKDPEGNQFCITPVKLG